MDGMLLASMVSGDATIRVADLGAGAGAAGLAVAARLPQAQVTLVERSPEMADFARRTIALPQNQFMSERLSVIEADVTLSGSARREAGLADNYFDHTIMNPPFNDRADRQATDDLKAQAHQMSDGLLEAWIKTACAITKPGGQLSLIARPQSIPDIIAACARRFGGLEITAIHPREGENATRILVSGIKGSKARLTLRAPLIVHLPDAHQFAPLVDDLNNGRRQYSRL